MIRSMSYSRYFRIATPRHTGSATPTPTAIPAGSSAGTVLLMTKPATATVDPAISHFSCCRRSPPARRQLTTRRAANTGQNTSRAGNSALTLETHAVELDG